MHIPPIEYLKFPNILYSADKKIHHKLKMKTTTEIIYSNSKSFKLQNCNKSHYSSTDSSLLLMYSTLCNSVLNSITENMCYLHFTKIKTRKIVKIRV